MATAVRIDGFAFDDPRFAMLAQLAGLADGDHARGKMARVWSYCTERNSRALKPELVDAIASHIGLAQAALKSDLASELKNGLLRIHGTKGRIEWKENLRQNALKGGGQTRARHKGKRRADIWANEGPPSPSPSPSPSQEKERDPRAGARSLASEAVAYLNQKLRTKHSPDAKPTLEAFKAIARDGYTLEQAKAVVDLKIREWGADERFVKNLRPSTLFRPSNFRRYVADAEGGSPALLRLPTTAPTYASSPYQRLERKETTP